MEMSKHPVEREHDELENLSRPVSPAVDNESLNDELPSYEGSQLGTTPAPEKSAAIFNPPSTQRTESGSQFIRPTPNQTRSASLPQQHPSTPPVRPTATLQPTTSSPFRFPTDAPPPLYAEIEPIKRPLAIPQTHASPAAPFITAYPTDLLAFGIPQESWQSFIETLSAFLSANISKQALHHATDVANSIGKIIPRRIVKPTLQQVSAIEQSARDFNPIGVVRGTVRLTVGTATRIVGSLLPMHNELWRKPSTPRARAEVYVATANKHWFRARGLQAWLLDTAELAELVGLEKFDLVEAAMVCRTRDAKTQLDALRDVLGDLQFDDVKKPEVGSSSSASSSPPGPQLLQLGEATLWLVLSQEGTFQGINGEYIGKGKNTV